MKKILALLLALIMVLSLCACGTDSKTNNDKTPAGSSDSTNDSTENGDDASEPSDSTNDPTGDSGESTEPSGSGSEETGYVGTWKVIPPDSNPFPPITLVINEDGTATWNGEPRLWYESLDPKEPEGAIEIAREDNVGYGDDAYITEDGKLYLEKNLTVGENSYDHIYFERQ